MACFVCYEGKDVGVTVPAAERGESPVHGHGGDHAVVVVECAIGGAF